MNVKKHQIFQYFLLLWSGNLFCSLSFNFCSTDILNHKSIVNIAINASNKKINNWLAYGREIINKYWNYGANKSWQICVRLSNVTRRTLKCFTLNAFQIQSQKISHTHAIALFHFLYLTAQRQEIAYCVCYICVSKMLYTYILFSMSAYTIFVCVCTCVWMGLALAASFY